MTVDTKLPYDKSYIGQFSSERNEPIWMKELRVNALEQAESLELPKPDKTKIGNWNFTRFKHVATGETISSLTELPAEIQDFFDVDNLPENLVIQRNHTVAFAKLNEDLMNKGVIFTDIFTALKSMRI